MSEPFIGEIKIVGFNFAPVGWALADGQLLPIAQHTALFSLYGTYYGGDGRTTFALPDLRGRVPMHQGTGPTLTPRSIGQKIGEEETTLTSNQMPSHNHGGQVVAAATEGDRSDPSGAFAARAEEPVQPYAGSSGTNMAAGSVQIDPAGGGLPFNTVQPSIVLNFVVALTGLYPSRS